MTTPLHIPDEAIRATYRGDFTAGTTRKTTVEILTLGAPLVVAVELRAQAARFAAMYRPGDVLPGPHTLAMVVAQLYARADEIEKGGQS